MIPREGGAKHHAILPRGRLPLGGAATLQPDLRMRMGVFVYYDVMDSLIRCSGTFHTDAGRAMRGQAFGASGPSFGTGFRCLRTDHVHDDQAGSAAFWAQD